MGRNEKYPKEVGVALWYLQPGETMQTWTTAFCDIHFLGEKISKIGSVIATETRLVIYIPKRFGRYELREIHYASISQFTVSKGLVGFSAALTMSGGTCRLSMMVDNMPELLLDFVRSQIGQKPTAPPPPPVQVYTAAPPPPRDIGSELEKLADLHTKGVLTSDEFARAKAKLIG